MDEISMEQTPKVSIIIPTLNEAANIGRCLTSIIKLENITALLEVIVIDNGSTDHTMKIVDTFSQILTIRSAILPGVNISALRNNGAKLAKGDIFAFLDADCTVRQDWLKNAVLRFKDPSVYVSGAFYRVPDDSTWVAKAWYINQAKNIKSGYVEKLQGGNLWIRRNVFCDVNGFDEQLITNEDYELCFRIRAKGYEIYSDPAIVAFHWGVPSTLIDFYKREKWHGSSVLPVFFKHLLQVPNLAVVLYSLYYAVLSVIFCFSIVAMYVWNNPVFPLLVLLAAFFVPVILTLKAVRYQRCSAIRAFQLSILNFIYGLARAACVVSIKSRNLFKH